MDNVSNAVKPAKVTKQPRGDPELLALVAHLEGAERKKVYKRLQARTRSHKRMANDPHRPVISTNVRYNDPELLPHRHTNQAGTPSEPIGESASAETPVSLQNHRETRSMVPVKSVRELYSEMHKDFENIIQLGGQRYPVSAYAFPDCKLRLADVITPDKDNIETAHTYPRSPDPFFEGFVSHDDLNARSVFTSSLNIVAGTEQDIEDLEDQIEAAEQERQSAVRQRRSAQAELRCLDAAMCIANAKIHIATEERREIEDDIRRALQLDLHDKHPGLVEEANSEICFLNVHIEAAEAQRSSAARSRESAHARHQAGEATMRAIEDRIRDLITRRREAADRLPEVQSRLQSAEARYERLVGPDTLAMFYANRCRSFF